MPPTLLVISGPPGSGKTRLAGRLARRLGWALLAKDDFKEGLLDAWGTGDADWSRRLSEAAFARQYAAAGEVLHRARPLILEGNFRRAHWPAIEALARRHGASLAQVACTASPRVLAARAAARRASGRRHPGHAEPVVRADTGAVALYGPLPIDRTVVLGGFAPRAAAALLAALGIA